MPHPNVTQGDQTRDAILAAIRAHWEANGYAPTVRELASAVDRSAPVTHGHLEQLAAGGMITWNPHRPRTIRLVPL